MATGFGRNGRIVWLSAWWTWGCTAPEGGIDSMSGGPDSGTSPTTGSQVSGTTGASTTDTNGLTSSGSTADDSDGTPEPRFDVATVTDAPPPPPPVIPETCEAAAEGPSSVGCRFFAVDMDQSGQTQGIFDFEGVPYAVAVANPQPAADANVVIEQKVDGAWQEVASATVSSMQLHPFGLPDLHQQSSGVLVGGAYRVSSDVPVVAYQFNPLVVGAASSDASILYPVTSWDTLHRALHWGAGTDSKGYLTVAAAFDGTVIEVIPAAPTIGGLGVAASAGEAFTITLDEGDIAEVMVAEPDASLAGTRVESLDPDKPIAVFSGHECAQIPNDVQFCDHLEEQLTGVRRWGTEFVAARMPVRAPTGSLPETTLWQVVASEDDTTVTVSGHGDVTGLPEGPFVLQAGEVVEGYIGGTREHPGDFRIVADRPIAVANFMTSAQNIPPDLILGDRIGDASLVQLSPVEQYLPRYVVLVANGWEQDFLVIARPTGADVSVDGVAVPDTQFIAVDAAYEVARVRVFDGVHTIEANTGVMVTVVGFDDADSYAYSGGAGTGVINPSPAG